MSIRGVEALFFDVFGTVVDYMDTVTRALRREIEATSLPDAEISRALKEEYDWQHFTLIWRRGYMDETKRLAAIGNPERVTVDQMHLGILNRLLSQLPLPASNHSNGTAKVGGITIDVVSSSLSQAWSVEVRTRLNQVWHALEPWPDSVEGMTQLKKHFKIGTLTNGNLGLMVDMAKNGKLPWDFILTADLLGSFKPDPTMYKSAMRLLDIDPDSNPQKACMVAAHIYDLKAAKECGMTTVFVSHRWSEDSLPESGKPPFVDIVVSDLLELANLAQAPPK
ncbi:haloacid dehalogenase [Testicularia cyperi]|uniref:Haloacid dehalogenase n=1 Tax=Testicularia cyperi TaxID=1882483 RepID=A0A317XL99_9BASI|nr:haloacid dehalogenase [Testicularia cyperi]